MRWFKFYGQDWLTDLKVRRLSLEDKMCFITLLCLASTANEGGLVRNCDELTLIELSNLRDNPYDDDNEYSRAHGCLKRYEALQIVTLHDNGDVTINNFERRQGENLSNAEKQKAYRERLKTKTKGSNGSNVTRYNDSNPRREEKRVEEKRREESKETTAPVSFSLFGEYQNVKLTEAQLGSLIETLGEHPTQALIIELDQYIATKGKDPYKDHSAVIKQWYRRRIQEHASKFLPGKPKMI